MLTLLLAAVPVFLAGLAATGMLFQRQGMRRDARHFPPPGRLLKTPAGLFHLDECGIRDGATVILESGLAGSSLSWVLVQKQLASVAHVLSYDRAGFGWSSPSHSPRTLQKVVEELQQLLEHSRVRPPYILVGHSFGGLIVRAFAHLHPDWTAGLVLVDPVSTEYWASCAPQEKQRLQRGIRLARRGELLAHLGLIRLVLNLLVVGRRFIPQAMARLTAPGATSFLQRLTREIQKLPPPLWPIVRAQWSRPMGFSAISSYLRALQDNCARAESQQLKSSVPTVVLSAATATPAEVVERDRWLQSSRDGRQVMLSESGHWIQIEQPDAVVGAVLEIIEKTA